MSLSQHPEQPETTCQVAWQPQHLVLAATCIISMAVQWQRDAVSEVVDQRACTTPRFQMLLLWSVYPHVDAARSCGLVCTPASCGRPSVDASALRKFASSVWRMY